MSTVVTVRGPLSDGAVARLCRAVEPLLRSGPVRVHVEHCDLSVVDAVSRLRLLARRCDGQLEVTGDDALLTYCGLASP